MMKIKLTDKREVCNFGTPYIIAEIASNHNGDIVLAKQLIQAAKDAGADCVKFQSFTKDNVFSRQVYRENYFLKDDYRNRADYTLETIVDAFSLSGEQLMEVREFAREIGIDWICTPFSMAAAKYLAETLDVPFIKIASMDLNHYPFLEYAASLNKPVLLATGLSRLDEIDKAVQVIENAGNKQIVLLHCVSIYPPDDKQVHLNNLDTFMKMYPYPIGFSDHTPGYSIPLAAVAKGACVIEKHFTLDKTMSGWDHKMSIDPAELKMLCRESKRIHDAMGEFRITSVESPERIKAFRRSVVSRRAMKKGDCIGKDDIDFKRPGTGIQPGEYPYLLGRTLARDIEADYVLRWEDLL